MINRSVPNTISYLIVGITLLTSTNSHAVKVKVSGQINRVIMDINNGEEKGVVHADNSASGTRWRLKGSSKFAGGLRAGLIYESQLQSNPSSKITPATLDSDGFGGDVGSGDNFTQRQSNIWIRGSLGKITIGLGNGAANGSAEADKSRTNVVQYVGASGSLLASMEYGNSGIQVRDARSSFDALGRHNNIRYDIKFGGVGLAVSHGNGDKVEVGLKYKFKKFELRTGFWDAADSDDDITGSAISASWGGKSGFNYSASFSGDDTSGDPTNRYFKVGYKYRKNAFGLDWSETRDLAPGKASSMSMAWINSSLKSIQTYLSYRIEELDASDDDITAFVAGARVKF